MTTTNRRNRAPRCSGGSGTASGDLISIAKKEEQQIEHDTESDDEVERALTQVKGLGGQRLACLSETGREPFLHRAEIGQPEVFEQGESPAGQGADGLLKKPAWIQFAGLNATK
jgi:hypothetical protein